MSLHLCSCSNPWIYLFFSLLATSMREWCLDRLESEEQKRLRAVTDRLSAAVRGQQLRQLLVHPQQGTQQHRRRRWREWFALDRLVQANGHGGYVCKLLPRSGTTHDL
ncbi:hypothetical protein BV898_11653 [Hypsibius exemplaris]|uniref:Uncharacterized protein n=1 Tax=Hypsibius exemplaris TaxID=2072580 RepID=A0A1W0WG74_HYPEX|nr:hypothetical protein BV898_11653 [Hypsibius exemplaris]